MEILPSPRIFHSSSQLSREKSYSASSPPLLNYLKRRTLMRNGFFYLQNILQQWTELKEPGRAKSSTAPSFIQLIYLLCVWVCVSVRKGEYTRSVFLLFFLLVSPVFNFSLLFLKPFKKSYIRKKKKFFSLLAAPVLPVFNLFPRLAFSWCVLSLQCLFDMDRNILICSIRHISLAREWDENRDPLMDIKWVKTSEYKK